ncbi:MAG: amidase [Proteobacteria bacterium]|nr:amidase [Pseudomonadota bacterium]
MTTSQTPTAPTSFVQDPGRLPQLASAIARRELSPVALVQRYLDRAQAVEPHVQSWREIDAEGALAQARQLEAEAAKGELRGALHGIPVAIKDIIDVEGLQTLANCRARARIAPATADAEIVLALRTAGAIILGKVHTTEFAFFDPSPARNPHNPRHTPGGSSSGSAAAVAAGTAPMAIGTQTVASVNRPAAYCGVAAFKPSSRTLSTFGITPLGPSYDTAGFFGWSVDDAVYAYEAVAPSFARHAGRQDAAAPVRIAIPVDPHTDDAIPEMKAAVRRAADQMATAKNTVIEKRSPISFTDLARIQRSTMLYEAGRALKSLLDHPAGSVGAKLTEAIHQGLAITASQYLDERRQIDAMRATFFEAFADTDVVLWPAAPGTAPEGLAWTGDPKYISPWTALGGPIVTLPAGKAGNGLPLGCILSAKPGADWPMTTWARRLAAAAEQH